MHDVAHWAQFDGHAAHDDPDSLYPVMQPVQVVAEVQELHVAGHARQYGLLPVVVL